MVNSAKILLCILSLTAVTSCRLTANFHEIDPGKYYRSAQLTGEEFQEAIDELGIKTIINLRGERPEKDWYLEEEAVAKKNGVKLINIHMSATRIPHRENLVKLLESFEEAQRPILLHCRAGVDRTGEASAIYQLEYMGKSKKQALKMLTFRYLHIQKKYPAMRYFIKNLYQGIEWGKETYDPCNSDYKYYDKAVFCEDSPTVVDL